MNIRSAFVLCALVTSAAVVGACSSGSDEAGSTGESVRESVQPASLDSPVSSTTASPSATATSSASTSARVSGAVPSERVEPGAMMSGEGYLRPGSGTEFQFSAGGGKWRCVMTEKVAGCVGAVPEAGKDGVEVTAGGKAGYVDDGAARFAIAGAVKELPVGRSLPNGKFVCTPFAEGAGSSGGGVQCETAAADHGFQMLEGQARFW